MACHSLFDQMSKIALWSFSRVRTGWPYPQFYFKSDIARIGKTGKCVTQGVFKMAEQGLKLSAKSTNPTWEADVNSLISRVFITRCSQRLQLLYKLVRLSTLKCLKASRRSHERRFLPTWTALNQKMLSDNKLGKICMCALCPFREPQPHPREALYRTGTLLNSE
jgi:hypothetical protein